MNVDDLIHKAEEVRKLKKLSRNGAGLASFLSGKDEIDILSETVAQELPVLYLRLNQRKEFFNGKENQDAQQTNINRDLRKVEEYLDTSLKTLTLQELKHISDYIYITNDKYSFDV